MFSLLKCTNKITIVVSVLVFNFQSYSQCFGPLNDCDNDGVVNSIDLDDDNDGILDATECGISGPDTFVNGSFELTNPSVLPAYVGYFLAQDVQGWSSTDMFLGGPSLEIWSTGYGGVPAANGNQFAEINLSSNSVLYQSFSLNGASGTITWSIKHRGRDGVDVANVMFGSTLATAIVSTPIAVMTDDNTAWGTYSGVYTIPPGQTSIVLAFVAVSTASGNPGSGNFIDDVQITINQGCADLDVDGIPNNLDLDSDGDACFDLNEFYGNNNYDLTPASIMPGDVVLDGICYIPYTGTGINSNGTIPSLPYVGNLTEVYTYGGVYCSIALPVDIVYFNANCLDEYKTEINWKTASEINCEKFDLERSSDGEVWELISSQNCLFHEGGAYTYIENSRLYNTTYYRLKKIDKNGSIEYVEPISLTCDKQSRSFYFYPNPANQSVVVTLQSIENSISQVLILDNVGKVMFHSNIDEQLGKYQLPISLIDLSNGVYSLEVITDEGNRFCSKLIINH